MVKLISFAEAIKKAGTKRPHVLLGNGFSRAVKNDIFAYDALFDRAEFAALPLAKSAFSALATTDFEVVIRALQSSAAIIRAYRPSEGKLAKAMEDDAAGLRELLVRTIAASHPEYPAQISDASYAGCREFLANFEKIYSVNYDLLLYWALMHDELEPPVKCDDGFRSPEDPDTEYVTWEVEKSNAQNVFYLHGALHIFDSGHEMQKYTWSRTGVRLIDQTRAALSQNLYPVFVAEGESEQKRARIRHNELLFRAYRSFAEIQRPLFTYGLSFAKNDEHLLRLMDAGKFLQLFVSIYGNPSTPDNARIIRRVIEMTTRRSKKRPLEINFYDAGSAHAWG